MRYYPGLWTTIHVHIRAYRDPYYVYTIWILHMYYINLCMYYAVYIYTYSYINNMVR